MSYTVIITEETAANITVSDAAYPITIEYNATNLTDPTSYGNAQVAAYLASGTLTSNVDTQGNVIADQWVYAGGSVSATGNVLGANVLTGGYVLAVGNVTGDYFIGNGSQLTGLPATYANADVAAYLASGTNTSNIITSANIAGNNVSSTAGISAFGTVDAGAFTTIGTVSASGNVTGNYFIGNGSQLTGLPATYANADVANFLANYGSNTLSTTGNVTAGYFLGNGSQLTGLPATYANSDVAAFLAAFGSNTIVTTGNITGGNVLAQGAVITGSGNVQLEPAGTVSVFPGTLGYMDNVIIGSSQARDAFFGAVSATGNINSGNIIVSGGNIETNGTFVGNGAGLSNLVGANVNGQVGEAGLANYVTANAQANITSLGTLSSLSVTGNVTTSANFVGNGAALTNIVGGSNTQVQFNNGGVFAGNANVTFDNSTGNLAMGNLVVATGYANVTEGVSQNWLRNPNPLLGNTNTAANYIPGRYLIGGGVGGAVGSSGAGNFFSVNTNARQTRVYIADRYTKTDTGLRSSATATEHWVDVSGNVGAANSNSRIAGVSNNLYVGGNGAGNLVNNNTLVVRGINNSIDFGTSGTANVGNIIVAAGSGISTFVAVNAGSQLGNFVGFLSLNNNNTGNLALYGHAIGLAAATGGTAPETFSTVYLANTAVAPGGAGVSTSSTPTNFWFLNNTDLRSKSRVGPIESFYERPYTFATTTGNADLDWTNGTSQQLTPTGTVNLSFTGATTATNGDLLHTLTLIVSQGATGYDVTLPAASSTIKYAGNVSTVGNTANSVTMISVTAANIAGSTTYLATVSPEFV